MSFFKKKPKLAKSFKEQPRTHEEINKDYNLACGLLGDRYFRMSAIQSEITQLTQQLGKLNVEANSIPKTVDQVTEEVAK